MVSVFSLGACQSSGAGSGGGEAGGEGGAVSTSSHSVGSGGGVGATSSASTGVPACSGPIDASFHVDAVFQATMMTPGCEAPKHLREIDGVVSYDENGKLHVKPFVPDTALCIESDYRIWLDLGPAVMAANPPIPTGAFVHVVSTGDDVQQFNHALSITNLPSFDGQPNPVASHGALWLFISSATQIGPVSNPSDDFAVTTPVQCGNLGDSVFALHVEAVATSEAVTVEATGRGILTITGGPEAGSYAVINGGIESSESLAFVYDTAIFRLAD